MISDDKLKEWRALCENATPGGWWWDYEHEPTRIIIECKGPRVDVLSKLDEEQDDTYAIANAAFIAAARTAVPALLDEVERLKSAVRIRNDEAMIFRGERDALRSKLAKARAALEMASDSLASDQSVALEVVRAALAEIDA